MTRIQWSELAQNPESIDTLYDLAPTLDGVALVSLKMSREGPNIETALDLHQFPDHPPQRWHSESNAVVLYLSFWDVTEFRATGLRAVMNVKVDISRDAQEDLNVIVSNIVTKEEIRFKAGFFLIERLSPYVQDAADG